LTGQLRETLEEEKRLLVIRQKERDFHRRCDEIAAKLSARTRTKAQLDA
jgi:hypothetical protein